MNLRNAVLRKIPWRAVLATLVLIAASAIGYYFGTLHADSLTLKSVRYQGKYHFINSPLYTEVPESAALPEYASLRDALARTVNSAINAGKAADIAIYVRDLNENRWVGINEDTKFAPGSLMKVGTLMTVLRLIDLSPARLAERIYVTFGPGYVLAPQEYFPPSDLVQNGGIYRVDDLLSRLIIQSDNSAAETLASYYGVNELGETFADLAIPVPSSTTDEPVSPHIYSHFFRALYNGTYLSREASEWALELLSKTAFTDGIIAGVPSGTLVAHKFGERSLPDGTNELHDCGIVYYPQHPYLLCVMTKGTSTFPTLATIIKEASVVSWEEFSKKYRNYSER